MRRLRENIEAGTLAAFAAGILAAQQAVPSVP
jgi:hypothetical protein